MRIVPLQQVECAILHDEHRPVPARRLLDTIGRMAKELGLGEEVTPLMGTTEKDLTVFIPRGQLLILISQVERPLGTEGFRTALTCPYTGMIFPEARSVVNGHAAYTLITVGKGPLAAQVPEELLQILGEALIADVAFTDSAEVMKAMTLCRRLTEAVLEQRKASAVHWCMSDMLMPPRIFDILRTDEDNIALSAKPVPFSSRRRHEPHGPVGCVFRGAPYLIGKALIFDEAPVPFSWMMEKGLAFLRYCIMRNAVIPHMDTFQIEGDSAKIGVVHEEPKNPKDMYDPGEVHLVVLHAPEFNIGGQSRQLHPGGVIRKPGEKNDKATPGSPSALRGSLPQGNASRPAAAPGKDPAAQSQARGSEDMVQKTSVQKPAAEEKDIVALMRHRLKQRARMKDEPPVSAMPKHRLPPLSAFARKEPQMLRKIGRNLRGLLRS
ncbi:hypothetical protein [Thermopetrobacter sp. TC1]|uniref:hypothetical protein n=1 Tax=Thermopetrobacter sp. TC1 TaxID=1495045 RepID=UPI000570BD26|nr:hypothetical protein [Thermopetrobacter sp. TC1]